MPGPSDAVLTLGQVLWADAELCRIEVDYGDRVLSATLREIPDGVW